MIVPLKMLTIAFFFHMWRRAVASEAIAAGAAPKADEKSAPLLKIKSVVFSLKHARKRTAIEIAGINFSMNPKNAGVFLLPKITKGRTLSAKISAPTQKVAITASRTVNFILILLILIFQA